MSNAQGIARIFDIETVAFFGGQKIVGENQIQFSKKNSFEKLFLAVLTPNCFSVILLSLISIYI